MNYKNLLATSALSTLLLAATSTTVWAQTAEEENDAGIGDIVVTAQKRAENIQDVPIAISAVSSEYLESRGISSIDRLGSIAPNVKIERAPSNKTISQISIRGSVTINPAVTWEPAVGLYLDGVYIAKAQGSIFDVADLERVEILRGPQGTLYGRNALAGAVNLVTKKPTGELGGSAEISYGNYDYWKAKAVVDLPAFGPFSLKLSGQIQKRDGFIKIGPNPFPAAFLARPNAVDETNDLDGKSAMVQLRIEPSDTLTVDYAFDYSEFDQRPDYAQLVYVNRNADPRDIFDPNSPSYPFVGAFFPLNLYTNADRQSSGSIDANPLFEKSRTYGHGLTVALEVGDMTIKSISSYRNLRWSDSIDLDGSPLNVAFTQRFTKFHSFSQELQATGTAFNDRLNYVLGGFYYKEKAETLGPQSFFGGGSRFQSDYGSHTTAYALYTQLDYKLTDALKLTLGARYTHEKKDIRRFLQVLADPAIPPAFLPFTVANIPYGGVPDATYNNFSPAATLSYDAGDNINVYARFARGFKSGGFNGETNEFVAPTAACPTGATELCNPYRPEKIDSYELGIKTKWFDNHLILNFAAFNDEHKDIQLSVFKAAGAASSSVLNAAAARIRGFEIEAIARPANWLTINGSFAILNAKYLRFIDPITNTDVSDNRAFPHTPKYTAALGVDWRVVEGDWGKLNLTGDLNFVSEYYTFPFALRGTAPSDQVARTTRSRGRSIVNLRAALSDFRIGGVRTELAAWVRNLTKEDNPSNFIDFGPGFGGLTVGYFPDPRTYGLTFGVKF